MRLGGQRKRIARPNMLRRARSGDQLCGVVCSNRVSFDSGDVLRQGGALGDGKIVHLLVRCIQWKVSNVCASGVMCACM